MEKDEVIIRRVRDLEQMAYSRDIVTFTGFLNLNERNIVNSLDHRNTGVKPEFYGGYPLAERQIAAFIPDALSYEFEYPVVCIQIMNKGAKFNSTLTHRDYLGALIHLGIDRSTLGDILVKKDCAYVFCLEHMADYILENLCTVKHTNVLPRILTESQELPKPEYQSVTGSVSSLRLDSVIAVAFRESRSSLVQNIENGSVFVNGKQITSNGYHLEEGDIVSLRGKGKFQYVGTGGQSKKGRYFITVNRYI